MFVLGVDPGVARCGYAVLSRNRHGIEIETAGVIMTSKESPLPLRLLEIHTELSATISQFKLEVAIVERVLFQTNVKTAMSVAKAAGMALLAAAAAGVEVVEISTNEMKLALAGDGSATKIQLQETIQRLLGLVALPKPPDVVDAIGLAYTYLSRPRQLRSNWEFA